MLVLTQKKDDRITIQTPDGKKIVVVCVRTGRHSIKIGIDAPANCNVLRQECFLPLDEIDLVRETIREEWAA
ncbi:MAG: carbon storage regulator [Planctomycetia bacterium]|nr:carbon storage regulator [Planctomycetia bacterium]